VVGTVGPGPVADLVPLEPGGGEALVRLPLRYPLKGTRALVGAAIEEAESPAALLAALGVTRLGGTAHRDSSEV